MKDNDIKNEAAAKKTFVINGVTFTEDEVVVLKIKRENGHEITIEKSDDPKKPNQIGFGK